MPFGQTPISTTPLSTNQFPASAGYTPDTPNGDFTAVESGPSSTDTLGNKHAPLSVYGSDGNLVTIGTTTDVAWSGTGAGTLIALLKKLVAELAGTLTVNANAGTNLNTSLLAQESGGNLAALKTDADAINTAIGGVSDATWSGSGNGSEIAILKKIVAELAATLNVSGTVTSNIGTTNGLALDTSVSGVLVSQGSTTSGEKGPLVQGAVTTSAPSYTTAQTSPISLTTAGAVRTDSSATTQPVSAASLPLPGGASISAKQPALGTAGSASSDVITVQGIASMTALKTDGSGVTQPVSGTITANAGSGTFTNQQSNVTSDYDSGAGTQNLTMFGVALPASGGAVAGGTSTNPLRTDPTGTTTQPVSGTITANAGTGSFTVAQSTASNLKVDLSGTAANATAIKVDGSAVTQPVSGTVSITSNSAVNVAQVAGTATDTNSGNKSAGTQRVVLATDQPQLTNALKVDGSGVTQPVSGTVTANAGSGTFTNQQSNITTDYDTGAGTQTMTMFGVALPASGGSVAGGTSTNPIRTDPTGTTTQPISGTVTANAGSGTFTIQSNASVNLNQVAGSAISTAATGIPKVGLTDGSGNAITSTSSAIDVNIKSGGGSGFSVVDEATFTAGTNAFVPTGGVFNDSVAALTSGQQGDVRLTNNRAMHVNLRDASANQLLGSKTSANSLPVVIASDQGAVAVTANAGTNLNTSALALDTSVNGILLAQASTTSGQKGPLVLGAVTTAAPSYTTAQSNPLSLTTAGALRVDGSAVTQPVSGTFWQATQPVSGTVSITSNSSVNVAQVAGTATDTNSGNKSAGTLRVVLATDQPALTNKLLVTPDSVALPANQSVNVSQINGVTTTMGNGVSGTGVQRVTIASDSTGQVTLAAGAATIGAVTQASGPWTSNVTQFGGNNVATGTGASGTGIPRVTVSNDSRIQHWDGTNGPVTVKPANTPPTLADLPAVQVIGPANTGLPVNTPGIVQKTNNKSSGSVASLALAFGGNNVAGNSIIVVCGVGNGTAPTISDTLSNTYTQASQVANGTALNVAVFYAVGIASGANTVTVNNGGTTASIAMEIYEVSGLIAQIQAQPDQTATSTGSSGTASTATISAISPNEYAFAGVGVGTAAQTITAGSGWTNDSGQQNPTTPAGLFSFVSMSQFLGSLKAVTPQATFTSEPWAIAVASFRPVILGIEGTTKLTDGTVTMAFGQNTMANSVPVVVASNQSNMPINVVQIAGSSVSTAATGVQKVGMVGNTGATVDSTVGAGTAPTNALVAGMVYNSSAPAPTTGQAMAVQADQAGNLRAFPGIALATLSAWNSSTSLNATQNIFTNSGAEAVLVQLTQTTTLTAGAITFEVSYDNSNWSTIPANCVLDPTSSTFAQISLPYTVQASTNKAILLNSNGAQGLRIKLSTQITGTGTVTPNYALLPASPADTVIALSPTAANFNAQVTQSGTWTVQPGNTANTTAWLTQPVAGTSGGSTASHTISASGTNATNLKSSAGTLYGFCISNSNAAARFFKLYNTSSAPTVGTTTPVMTVQLPANATVIRAFPVGLNFGTGISWGLSTGIADNDTGSVGTDISVDLDYK